MLTTAIESSARSPVQVKMLGVLSGSLILIALLTSGCSSACENQVVDRITSPDNNKVLYIFERDCGATTDFVTHVAVLARSAAFDSDTVGNVFVADSNRGKVKFTVRAKWISPSAIEIAYPSGSRVYKKITDANGIQIAYGLF